MMRALALVTLLFMTCALVLVYSQQRSRMLYAEKNRLEIKHNRLNQEWSRLEFEQRDLSKSSRILSIATKQLQMKEPKQDKTVYVKEKAP